MASPSFSAHWNHLLCDGSPSDSGQSHLVQIYETDGFLSEAVSLFIGTGLKVGEGAILVATAAHLQTFKAALAERQIDVETAEKTGQLVTADAQETIDAYLIEGKVHGDKFKAAIEGLFRKTPHSRVRIFGEMVELLWVSGQTEAVQEVEHLWNGVISHHPCSLLCGYDLNIFKDEARRFESVCGLHSHVLPSESILKGKTIDEQLSAIAQLQQKAQILEFELERRKHVELSLRTSLAQKEETEDLLLTSETFRNAIVDHSFDCIKVLDLDAHLVFMNKNGLKEVDPRCHHELMGSNWIEYWRGDFKELAANAVEAAKNGEVGDFIGYMPVYPLKQDRWWHVVVSPLTDSDGKIIRLLAVSRDVTETKRIEQELRQSIQVRDEFLSMASHELRTPITSLRLQLEMARDWIARNDVLSIERLKRIFAVSCRQVERLTSLVDNMLDVSTFQESRPRLRLEIVDLKALILEVCEGFRDQFRSSGCELDLHALEDVVGIWDKCRLEQVVVNLITNVLKYAPGCPVKISLTHDETAARFTIKDWGPGIAIDKQATIFQRFQQPSSCNVSGLGLGLFITEQIVQAHLGQIHVNSREGEGAEFIVNLPLNPTCTTASGETAIYPFVPFYHRLKQSYEFNDTHH